MVPCVEPPQGSRSSMNEPQGNTTAGRGGADQLRVFSTLRQILKTEAALDLQHKTQTLHSLISFTPFKKDKSYLNFFFALQFKLNSEGSPTETPTERQTWLPSPANYLTSTRDSRSINTGALAYHLALKKSPKMCGAVGLRTATASTVTIRKLSQKNNFTILNKERSQSS